MYLACLSQCKEWVEVGLHVFKGEGVQETKYVSESDCMCLCVCLVLVSVVWRPVCHSQQTPFLAHSYTPPSAAGCPALTCWIIPTLLDYWPTVCLHQTRYVLSLHVCFLILCVRVCVCTWYTYITWGVPSDTFSASQNQERVGRWHQVPACISSSKLYQVFRQSVPRGLAKSRSPVSLQSPLYQLTAVIFTTLFNHYLTIY